MRTKKEVEKVVIDIIQVGAWVNRSRIQGDSRLTRDLDIDDDEFWKIKEGINKKYSLSLKKKHIRNCIYVNAVTDLVYEQINHDSSGIDEKIKRMIASEATCSGASINGNDTLKGDLKIDNDAFKEIKNSINQEYNLDLKKKDIKSCDNVSSVVSLVCKCLNVKDPINDMSPEEEAKLNAILENM